MLTLEIGRMFMFKTVRPRDFYLALIEQTKSRTLLSNSNNNGTVAFLFYCPSGTGVQTGTRLPDKTSVTLDWN